MFDPAANIAPTKINSKNWPPYIIPNILEAHPYQKIEITSPIRAAESNPLIPPAIPADIKSSLINPNPIPANATPITKLAQFIFKNKQIVPITIATIVAIIAKTIAPPNSSAMINHLLNIILYVVMNDIYFVYKSKYL